MSRRKSLRNSQNTFLFVHHHKYPFDGEYKKALLTKSSYTYTDRFIYTYVCVCIHIYLLETFNDFTHS